VKPLSLTVRGFRHYRAEQTISLPDGCWGIVGANGSGKSSVLQAIDVALFGPEGRSLGPYVTWGEDTMSVQLEFDHAGDRYRVRRQSLRGKTTMDLERLVPE
jgi:DNA repair exonuclease SbcCD ATPase subunit